MKQLGKIIIFIISTIRPVLGPKGCCKYLTTCTEFADIQFKTQPFHLAVWLIFKRVLACNPFNKNPNNFII